MLKLKAKCEVSFSKFDKRLRECEFSSKLTKVAFYLVPVEPKMNQKEGRRKIH